MNELVYIQSSDNDSGVQWTLGGSNIYHSGQYTIGNDFGLGYTNEHGAVRFPGVNISKNTTVQSATLKLKGGYVNSGRIYYVCYGIKENNTSDFGSSPFGRSRTTAKRQSNDPTPSTGNYFNIDVKDMVNEILAQSGWSSGNAMGFLIFEDGGLSTGDISDANKQAYLVIKLSADPNLKPSPVAVAAPTFPPPSDYGLRISQPGVDVKTATEAQLFYTSRKKQLRVKEELIRTNASDYAHGLGYAPFTFGFYEDAGNLVRIMNYPFNRLSVEPWVACDVTNIYAGVEPGKNAYIYIFIDPLL